MKINSLDVQQEINDLNKVEEIDISKNATNAIKTITRAIIRKYGHVYSINLAINVNDIPATSTTTLFKTELRPGQSLELSCFVDNSAGRYNVHRVVLNPDGNINMLTTNVGISEGLFCPIFGTIII